MIPRKARRQQQWLKLFLAMACLAFVFGYIPYFTFISDVSVSPTQTTSLFNSTPRDQLLLYRIIGNDLPPRHKVGQTLSNLHFILQHEPPFPDTRKIYVLNRIADPASEMAIIRLLNRFDKEYIRIPFVEEDYQKLDFRLEDFPEPDFLHSDDYRRYSKVSKLRALDYTYHDKNLYVMNNNGGRNRAIHHGRSMPNARWIMPFDGNCFLSENGFAEIKSQLDRYGDTTKYFVVPMTRLLNNSVLLNNLDERPKTPEEPQIIFRFDATEEYNLDMRYGRRSKLELLWRLGALENRRLRKPIVPWEPMERPYSKDKGNFRTIGWVYRLFSGNPQQEENKKEASSIRAFNRLLAIQSSLDSLDETLARRTFRHDALFRFNERAMAQIRYAFWNKEAAVVGIMDELARQADDVVETTQVYLSNVESIELPLTGYMDTLSRNVTLLTLANYYHGNEKYARVAANLVRIYILNAMAVEDEDEYDSARRIPEDSHVLDFLSDQGYSFPRLGRLSRVVPKSNRSRPLSMADWTKTDLSSFLDSLRLLKRAQALSHKEYIELQAMMTDVLDYLVTSPTGVHLAQLTDHRGVLYDLQVTALATFTDDVRLFLRVANRCRMRIGKHFQADGTQQLKQTSVLDRMQPGQTYETTFNSRSLWRAVLHQETRNLQYWTILARSIQNTGVAKDIWHYTARNGASISHSVTAHLKRYVDGLPKLSTADATYAKSVLRPLAQMATVAADHSNDGGQDQAWLSQHAATFGSPWSVENLPNAAPVPLVGHAANDEEHSGVANYDDYNAEQMGVPFFWMLTNQL
ncbi:uncharacterized protein BYT42DRAFT_487117 [Radiomyces spectabilis]|uniref:uncharacterized protein n=1 Tax=Radiomyces spectabilis TaxID=64574 RepID=UPI00221E89D5|nr:uncharacterized protein BYT42DRAFT_487117 [Radiomyces spectabilis]KAI8393940.1 hypothetical protein BYT42DRAFT_487117 [Radiomyces spectabilis]